MRPEPTSWNLSTEERTHILGSVQRVGRDKAIGYLPLYTIRDIMGLDVEDLVVEAKSRALSALVFGPAECCIKSGALYVFDQQSLAALLTASIGALISGGWPTEPDGFVRAVAADWVEPEHPVMPVIRKAFGEPITG